jgi:hypothetical protein
MLPFRSRLLVVGCRWTWATSLSIFLVLWTTTTDASILSTSDARLPMSLSMIISDLEVEGCLELTTACLVTSKGVSIRKQQELLGQMSGDTDDSLALDNAKPSKSVRVVGTSEGLVMCAPSEPGEVALTACACEGSVVYYADPVDLSRGEGLFDRLAPAMEKLLARKQQASPSPSAYKSPQLIVVCDSDTDLEATKAVLEREAESVVAHLISDRPLTVLQDVFERVSYVRADQVSAELLGSGRSNNPVDAAARVAETVDLETMFSVSSASSPMTSSISAQDLAAARKLGPLARQQVSDTVRTVRAACATESGEPKFVPDFGPMCRLATQQALDRLQEEAGDSPFWKARVAEQIRSTMMDELDAELMQLLEVQLDILSQDSFDECRKKLSKLLIGPNLAADMRQAAQQTLKGFAQQARQLVARQGGWTYLPALRRLETRFGDFISTRLEAAQASGQYRPLPRKGVTVGLHWLLPKPFGNDYRQEPWMVHAVDTMTYVPQTKKLSDVNPGDVPSGDWRSKIVPSPAGNDMVYLQ